MHINDLGTPKFLFRQFKVYQLLGTFLHDHHQPNHDYTHHPCNYITNCCLITSEAIFGLTYFSATSSASQSSSLICTSQRPFASSTENCPLWKQSSMQGQLLQSMQHSYGVVANLTDGHTSDNWWLWKYLSIKALIYFKSLISVHVP